MNPLPYFTNKARIALFHSKFDLHQTLAVSPSSSAKTNLLHAHFTYRQTPNIDTLLRFIIHSLIHSFTKIYTVQPYPSACKNKLGHGGTIEPKIGTCADSYLLISDKTGEGHSPQNEPASNGNRQPYTFQFW
ncbi:hypothetical protein [Fulvivirga sediminis]|uniref:Uncharacterized protein n=1 Tax=Fulvivirga sediminis TaxID=2803949 RepID=A0A937FAU5_9BACT|nr:hypothetical protein [Fulvivirga sediminis]MBL3657193.1 hypothetical protein [Fulvivirga sediminis]